MKESVKTIIRRKRFFFSSKGLSFLSKLSSKVSSKAFRVFVEGFVEVAADRGPAATSLREVATSQGRAATSPWRLPSDSCEVAASQNRAATSPWGFPSDSCETEERLP